MNRTPDRAGDARDCIGRVLEQAGVPESGVRAEWLLAHVLKCSRAEIELRRDQLLDDDQRAWLIESTGRLLRHEPLQYILGETDFMDLTLRVDPRALIPRPETEELVSLVLQDREIREQDNPRIADVGAGSGCIVLELIHARPQARYLATDISEEALALARENASAYGVESRIEWRHGDLLEGVPAASLDVVISNPPYIAASDFDALPQEVREYEPRGALDGGKEGLDILRRLIPQAYDALRNSGRLYLEIGADQGETVREDMRKCGFSEIRIFSDLSGHERVAQGIK